MTKCSSGVIVYMHTVDRTQRPASSGMRSASTARIACTSPSATARSIVSGSASSRRWWKPTLHACAGAPIVDGAEVGDAVHRVAGANSNT